MKEVLSLATFALGLLCFVAFVTTVKPTAIGAIQAARNYCRTDSSGMRGCDLHVFAAPEAIRSNHPMNGIETTVAVIALATAATPETTNPIPNARNHP